MLVGFTGKYKKKGAVPKNSPFVHRALECLTAYGKAMCLWVFTQYAEAIPAWSQTRDIDRIRATAGLGLQDQLALGIVDGQYGFGRKALHIQRLVSRVGEQDQLDAYAFLQSGGAEAAAHERRKTSVIARLAHLKVIRGARCQAGQADGIGTTGCGGRQGGSAA